jgi:hypothetical protein
MGSVSLAQKEVFQASKILIDFLRDFTFLSEQQLLSSKSMLEGIVVQVMNSMGELSETSNQKVKAAQQILVKDEKTGEFIASKRAVIEKKEVEAVLSSPNSEALRKIMLESKLLRSSGAFSKHLETISMLDGNLQKLLSDVIGAVSLDDVIAQRLSHVIESLQTLHQALAQFLEDYQNECRPDRVKLLRNKVLTKVYLSYSSEEEKEVFHRIFGHPKSSAKAS